VTYLIDTDWIADYLGGKQVAVDLLQALKDDGLAISLVTFGEIYDGVYHGRDPVVAGRTFLALLGRIDVFDPD
jgi:tRNA(fMet)-specific endonuclease VapC